MNKALQWMKGNVTIVVSAAVAFLSFCFVVAVTLFFRPEVIKSVETRVVGQTKKTEALLTQGKVTLPGKEPGSPMIDRKGIVATPALIESVKTIFGEFAKTGKDMRDFSRKLNGEAHDATCIMPENGIVTSFNYDQFRKNYRNSFNAALWNSKMGSPSMPALSDEDRRRLAINPLMAGPPLSTKELQAISDEEVKAKVKSLGFEKFSELGGKQREDVETQARNRVYDAIKARAMNVGIYAETDPNQPAWPFNGMMRDFKEGVSPDVTYECQADLWVLRDMVDALRLANHVGENGRSVLNAPVKRLLRLQVQREGYAGIQTLGLLTQLPATTGLASGASFQPPAFQFPAESLPQVENFFASPTGRISNSIYDVKHVKLEVIADTRRLSELLEAIGRVNAMTVVSVNVEDVDEYKELREGLYYYGPCDVCKATLVVETLWMRSWTLPKMPPETRKYLGIFATPTTP